MEGVLFTSRWIALIFHSTDVLAEEKSKLRALESVNETTFRNTPPVDVLGKVARDTWQERGATCSGVRSSGSPQVSVCPVFSGLVSTYTALWVSRGDPVPNLQWLCRNRIVISLFGDDRAYVNEVVRSDCPVTVVWPFPSRASLIGRCCWVYGTRALIPVYWILIRDQNTWEQTSILTEGGGCGGGLLKRFVKNLTWLQAVSIFSPFFCARCSSPSRPDLGLVPWSGFHWVRLVCLEELPHGATRAASAESYGWYRLHEKGTVARRQWGTGLTSIPWMKR